MRAAIALGSNLGERVENLKAARAALISLPAARPPFLSSSLYETAPVGCEPGAPQFLNAVIEIEYGGAPESLMAELGAIEKALGRPRAHAKNQSRTLDLDLLFFGDLRSTTSELELPHPRIAKRRFVLAPLAEICPDFQLGVNGKSVRAMLAELPDDGSVRRSEEQW